MIKKIIVISLIFIYSTALGCSSKSDTLKNEILETPEYSTSDHANQDDSEKEKFRVYNQGTEEDPAYIKVPISQNKISGVYYFEDEFNDMWRTDKTRFQINRPEGTEYTDVVDFGIAYFGFVGTTGKCNSLFRWDLCNNLSFEKNRYEVKKGCDVGCITVALYEDVYEIIPKVTIQIYGMKPDIKLFNEKYTDEDAARAELQKLYANFENDDFSAGVLLDEMSVPGTGVYYIDYTELNKIGKYEQYICVVRFSESMDYSYLINGAGTYYITDRAAFEQWKNEHKDQFLDGK